MSTNLNRLLDSQHLAQIVPENKGEVVVTANNANSSYFIFAAVGVVIILALLIIFVRQHKRRLRYRS